MDPAAVNEGSEVMLVDIYFDKLLFADDILARASGGTWV